MVKQRSWARNQMGNANGPGRKLIFIISHFVHVCCHFVHCGFKRSGETVLPLFPIIATTAAVSNFTVTAATPFGLSATSGQVTFWPGSTAVSYTHLRAHE